MHAIDKRLRELGIILPEPPGAVGNYLPVRNLQGIGFISGQFPLVGGKLPVKGVIGSDISIEEGKEAVRIAAINVLAQLRKATVNWDRLVSLGRVDGFFVTSDDFVHHPALLDAASDLFMQVLAEKGSHARMVMGVRTLPMNAPVELVVQFFTGNR